MLATKAFSLHENVSPARLPASPYCVKWFAIFFIVCGLGIPFITTAIPLLPSYFKTVTGTVRDAEGEPVAGASVTVKNKSTGTQTDTDGKFSIEAVEGDVLVVTAVGFTAQETIVTGGGSYTIALKRDVSELDQVVVVGYGTQKKVNLTGAISTVGSVELNKRPVSNVSNLLQGKVAGLQVSQAEGKPGMESNTLRIRGTGTFSSAGSSPLVLIDGITGDLNNLDPNDVESVSVLKDAASSSIYGARAANGVILVTTKKGRSGRISVEYNGNVQAQKATRLPKLLSNSADYMMYWNEGRVRAGFLPYFTDEEIEAYRSHPDDPVHYPNYNWIDESFRTATVQNHYLSVRGGGEKTTFNLSLGYLDQGGIISIYDYQKYNLLVSVESKVRDWFTLGGQIQFVKKDITTSTWDNTIGYSILDIYGSAPNYTPTMTLPDGTTGYVARYSSAIGEWTVRNPEAQDVSGSFKQNHYNVVPQVYANVKLAKNLSWYSKGAISLDDDFSKNHEVAVNNYYFNDGSFAHNNSPQRLGVQDNYYQNMLVTYYSTLNYHNVFNNVHNVNVLVGYNQEYNFYRQLGGTKVTFPTDGLDQLNAGSSLGQTTSGTANEWGIRSFFGRATYDFKGRYLFEANARYDGTSRIYSANRWGLFPSLSAGWRISEESFMKNIGWIQNLKLRGSWGQLGNQNIGNYPYQEVLNTTSYPFSSAYPGAVKSQMVDPSLKWETTTMTDVGVDLSIKEGLFTATFDWFNKVTDDILYPIPVPASIGLSAPTVNYGKMKNTGYEIEVGHGKQIGNFGYNVSFNFSVVKNEVLRILAPSYGSKTIQEGLPFNSLYMIEWIGIFQNQDEIDKSPKQQFNPKPGDLKFKDQNGDNVIDAKDRVVVPGAYPKFIYGGTINLSWKNLVLNAFFQGVQGQKISAQGLTWGAVPYIQGSPPTVDFVNNRWTGEGSTNKYPAMYISGYGPVTGTTSTFWLYDASYLRLKNLSVGYDIPQKYTQKIGLQGLNVYFSGDNLLTFTKYPGADPEKSDNGWFTSYPQITIYTFGVKVKL
jgi:TonB-linked SusC/RagA family outer membrane protein